MVSPSKQTSKAFDSRKPYRVKLVKGPKPLIYYKFFLDIEKNDTNNKIENQIKELGGFIDFFLSSDITHFITDRSSSTTATTTTATSATTLNNASTSSYQIQQPVTPKTPFSFDSNACQSLNSPSIDIKSTPKKPIISSRTDAMIQQLTRQKSIDNKTKSPYFNKSDNFEPSPIQKARNCGATIWSTEYALRFLERIVQTIRVDEKKRQQELYDEEQQYKKLNKKKLKHFKDDYIKVESFQKIYRPIYREFKSWPMINLRRRLTGSPFDLNDDSQGGSKNLKKSSKLISTNQQQRATTTTTTAAATATGRTNGTSTRNMTRKSRTKTTTSIRVSGNNKNSGTVTVGGDSGTKDIIEHNTIDNTNNTKQCGYCELCHLEYDVLTVHLQSKEHVNFVKNDKNFLTLDNLINSSSANVEQFLKLNTSETGNNNQNCNTRKNGTVSNRQSSQPNSGKLSSPPPSQLSRQQSQQQQHQQQQHKSLSSPPSSPHNKTKPPLSPPPYLNNTSSCSSNNNNNFNNNNRKRSSCGNSKSVDNNYKILNNSNNYSDNLTEKNIVNGGTNVVLKGASPKAGATATTTSPVGGDDSPDEDNPGDSSPKTKANLSARLKQRRATKALMAEVTKKTITRSAKIFADVEVTPEMLLEDGKDGPRSRRESCKRVNYAEPREEEDNSIEDKYGIHVRINDNPVVGGSTIKINESIRWRAPSPNARDRPPIKSPLLYGTLMDDRKDPKRNLLKPVVTLERKNYLPDSCNLTSPSTKLYTNREMDPKSGLIVKFKRVRQAELNLLNDEAENFMFPKKEPFSDCETDEDRQSTSEPMEMSAEIVTSEIEPMIMRQYKDYPKTNSLLIKGELKDSANVRLKAEGSENKTSRTDISIKEERVEVDEEEEMEMEDDDDDLNECSPSKENSKRSRTCNRKRRNQLEAFLDDNSDYYKFENPSSRLRFQDAPVQSLTIDTSKNNDSSSNAIDSTEDRTGGYSHYKSKLSKNIEESNEEDNKWKLVNLKAKEIDKYKFAFERVPNTEPWYEAFQRQDECRERIYEYFGNTAYRKLPFELGPLPPLKPNCCVLNYTPNRKKKKSVSTASSASSSTASQLGKKKSKLKDDKRKYLLDADKPRISPREHASTLAILSSFIQESKKKNVNICIQSDNEDDENDDDDDNDSERNPNNADDDSQNHNIVFSPPKFGESYVNINNLKKQWDDVVNNSMSLDEYDIHETVPEINDVFNDSVCINDDEKCDDSFINIINTCPKERLTYKSVHKNEMMVKRRVYYNTKNRVIPQHLSRFTVAGKKRSINRTGWPNNKRRIIFSNRRDAAETSEQNGVADEALASCETEKPSTSTNAVLDECDKDTLKQADGEVVDDNEDGDVDIDGCEDEGDVVEDDEEMQDTQPDRLLQSQQSHLDEMNSIASDILAVSSDSIDTVVTDVMMMTSKMNDDRIHNKSPFISDENDTGINSLVEDKAALAEDEVSEGVLELMLPATDEIGSEGYGTAASDLKRELKIIIPKIQNKIQHKIPKSPIIYTNMTTRSSSKSPTKSKLSPKKKKKIAAGKKLNAKKSEAAMSSALPNNTDSRATSPKKFSPRKLRKPRGRWYRER